MYLKVLYCCVVLGGGGGGDELNHFDSIKKGVVGVRVKNSGCKEG